MTKETKKGVIITFKPKEQRPDKSKDKLAVIEGAIESKVNFLNADNISRGVTIPSGMPEEMPPGQGRESASGVCHQWWQDHF